MSEATTITVDLSKELSKEELESFKEQAKKQGGKSLKDHFLDVTIRNQSQKEGAA